MEQGKGVGSSWALVVMDVDWVKWSDKVGWIWSGNYLVVCLV